MVEMLDAGATLDALESLYRTDFTRFVRAAAACVSEVIPCARLRFDRRGGPVLLRGLSHPDWVG
jgi:hypothetical protein